MTEELIAKEISLLADATDERLEHLLKCSLSRKSTKEKELLKPLIKAVEKERKSRGTKTISSKIVQPTIKEKDEQN